MKDLRLNSQGDLVVEDDDLTTVDDIEELKQRIKLALSIHENEWFLDVNAGINYIEILGEKNSEEELKKEILKVINPFDEIEEVTMLKTNYDGSNRSLVIEFTAELENGEELGMEIEEVV